MRLFVQLFLVALGSSIGGVCRWLVAIWAGRTFGTTLPIGTLIINISGSFFLGWFVAVLSSRLTPSNLIWLREDDLRLLIAVGFTGSYTTFSTFEVEGNSLLADGETAIGLAYMCGSVVLGLLAVRLGIHLGKP